MCWSINIPPPHPSHSELKGVGVLSDMTQTEVTVSLKVALFPVNDAYCAHTWSECIHSYRARACEAADGRSVNLPLESAITSSSSLHHSQHLCKHRATAAKHHCWPTVNTPPLGTMCHYQPSTTLHLYRPPQKVKPSQFFILTELSTQR